MRWTVEVSSLGEGSDAQSYSVEAKAWQAALQEARKLRGDAGPLSKLSIELLDDGYRAVDPKKRVRYVVHKEGAGTTESKAPGKAESKAPQKSESKAPQKSASKAPRKAESKAPAKAGSKGPQQSESKAPAKKSADAAAKQPGSIEPVPTKSISGGASAQPPRSRPPSSAPAPELPHRVLVTRDEEPSEAVPLTYRERVFAVQPGADRDALEVLLRRAFVRIRDKLSEAPSGQFIQLAVFDHEFEQRPERPPLATLVWKDWRGEPVLQFTGEPEPPVSAPTSQFPSVDVSVADDDGDIDIDVDVDDAPAKVEPEPAKAQAEGEAKPTAPDTAEEPSRGQAVESAAGEPRRKSKKAKKGKKAPEGSAKRKAKGERRGADEDLIGDLFEQMHDLHFISDVVGGTQFVLEVLERTLPSEAVIIHVFDIDNTEFVVVRAAGPKAGDVLTHRTDGNFGTYVELLRSTRAMKLDDVNGHAHFSGGAVWKAVGVSPSHVLAAPVIRAGRYLGIVELANPDGGGGYHDGEVNALQYICEQFADFLSDRPIVVDDEAITMER